MNQQYSDDDYMPKKKFTSKEVFTHPVFFIMIGILAVGIWFGSSFVETATNPSKENSLNYYGEAEVMDIGETPSKCFVYIKRDDGRETKQRMRKSDCGKFRVGDMINIENGQYVSTVRDRYKGGYPAGDTAQSAR